MLACVVQVYFEQFLPTDNSWPEHFGLETERFKVRVAPRHHGDDLFPEDIDRTMSTMEFTLTPLAKPGGSVVTRVGERVMDRIGLTVIDDSRTPAPMSLHDLQMDEMVDTALEVAAGIIAHCRTVSESPWLRGVQREHRPQDQRLYTLNPHTVTWFAGDEATALAPLAVYEGAVNATASSGAIRSPEAKRVAFGHLLDSLKSFGREPDIVRELLVTAEERLIQLHLREAVVALASALEIAAEAFVERYPTADLSDIRSDRSLSFAMRHYARIPDRVAGRSLQADDPDTFGQIEAAYRTRNNVAHAGALEYRRADGTTVQVDRHAVQMFLGATRHAITWLVPVAPPDRAQPTSDT